MNCENIKEKLSLYIDNLLDPDEREKIREHIESCDSCRIYYDKLLKLGQIVNNFVTTDKTEYWESQKDKVMDKIEQAESEKIINVQPVRKQNRFYKYLAVAASLALVGFVSIYESQEFNQVKGLFDDSEETTTEQLMETDSAEDIEVRGGRAGETTFEAEVPTDKAESIDDEIMDKDDSIENIVDSYSNKPAIAPKKRTEKSQAVPEKEEKAKISESVEGELSVGMPKPVQPMLKGVAVDDVSIDDESPNVIRFKSKPPLPAEVEPLTIKSPQPIVEKEVGGQQTEILYKASGIKDDKEAGNLDMKMSVQSDEGKEYMMEPRQEKDSAITEVNIYRIRLDSLEEKYAGIYSPHYRESSAKGRAVETPVSLDPVVLEIAETCFQVGILSLDENEREEMIDKLRQLSIHGSPETIEKIQRYIVLLLTAE